METVEIYVSRGDYKGALRSALEIGDSLKRLLALVNVLIAFPRDEVLAFIFETADSVTGTPNRAVPLSIVGRALYALDRDSEAEVYFERALSLAHEIRSSRLRGEVFAAIARNLVLSGRYSDALSLFTWAVELLQTSRGLSSDATEGLLKVAHLIERSADEVPNEGALEFYTLARDVYSSIFFSLQAKHIDGKIKLIRDVLRRGRAAVEELLERGDVEPAIEMMRFLPLESRAVAMLKLAYWLFLHERPTLGRKVFEDALEIFLVGKFGPKDAEMAGIARKFLRLGLVEQALVLTGLIRNPGLYSSILGDVALAYVARGDTGRALSIAEGIPDESVKRRVLEALEGGKDVGHEQGLPLTGRGEECGAVPEDGGGSEVQGKVGQEEGDSAGKGDGSRDTGDEVQLR